MLRITQDSSCCMRRICQAAFPPASVNSVVCAEQGGQAVSHLWSLPKHRLKAFDSL